MITTTLIDALKGGMVFGGSRTLIYYGLPLPPFSGLVLEFGVYRGESVSFIADHLHPHPVYGFDSFEGLPEAWNRGGPRPVYEKGHFGVKKVPDLMEENVTLIPGWFKDSIPPFLEKHPGDVAFLNIDCDLYSSTKTVLTLLNDRIVPGTVIHFDELSDWDRAKAERMGNWEGVYPNWKDHEYRALVEWMQENGREVEAVARNDDFAALLRVTR